MRTAVLLGMLLLAGGALAARTRIPTASALRNAMIAARREAVVRLRDTGEIDDTVLRRVQHHLDIEELLSDAGVEP